MHLFMSDNEIYFEELTQKNKSDILRLYNEIYSKQNHSSLIAHLIDKPSFFGLCGYQGNQAICFLLANAVLDEIDIIELAVKENFRRRGVAFKLLSYFQLFCIERKMQKVFLEVAQNNAAAISLYEKLGFNRIGLRKNYYSQNGFYIDGYSYCKNVNAIKNNPVNSTCTGL